MTLTEFRPGPLGPYEMVVSTNRVFETGVPYPIKIDLSALTALRNEYRQAEKGDEGLAI